MYEAGNRHYNNAATILKKITIKENNNKGKTMALAVKIATLLGWLVIIANWVMPFGGQLETILHWSGIGLAAAHAIEMLVYIPLVNKATGSKAMHYLQIFIFGFGHFLVLKEQAQA
jgi:uncharacterized protein YhhL (DUF1145 family)